MSVPVQHQGNTNVPAPRESGRERDFPLTAPFVLVRPPMGWVSLPTSGRAVSWPQFSLTQCSLNQRHPQRHVRGHVQWNVWARGGPVKVTYESNHHISRTTTTPAPGSGGLQRGAVGSCAGGKWPCP